MKPYALIICLTVFYLPLRAQHFYLEAGTQIPLQYYMGMEYQPQGHLSFNVKAGIITKPYDQVIMNIMESLGTNDFYTEMIKEAFQFGLMGEFGIRYKFHKMYIGIFSQFAFLTANEAPEELIEDYYGIPIGNNNFPRSSRYSDLEIKSNIFQMGLMVGRKFQLKNPKFQVRTELGISKNIFSNSALLLDDEEVPNLSYIIDEELQENYSDYLYVPTITVSFVYSFTSEK